MPDSLNCPYHLHLTLTTYIKLYIKLS